jgi:hypothetical protein
VNQSVKENFKAVFLGYFSVVYAPDIGLLIIGDFFHKIGAYIGGYSRVK